MSVRLPPHVELMREEILKTLSSMSKMRSLEAKPQTCVFLPKQKRSGSTPWCCQRPHRAGEADAGLDLVEDQQELVLVRELTQLRGRTRDGNGCRRLRPGSAR